MLGRWSAQSATHVLHTSLPVGLGWAAGGGQLRRIGQPNTVHLMSEVEGLADLGVNGQDTWILFFLCS